MVALRDSKNFWLPVNLIICTCVCVCAHACMCMRVFLTWSSCVFSQQTNVVVVQQQPTHQAVVTTAYVRSDIPDYFVLSIVLTILCIFFNWCALFCTIPAIFLSIQVCCSSWFLMWLNDTFYRCYIFSIKNVTKSTSSIWAHKIHPFFQLYSIIYTNTTQNLMGVQG